MMPPKRGEMKFLWEKHFLLPTCLHQRSQEESGGLGVADLVFGGFVHLIFNNSIKIK